MGFSLEGVARDKELRKICLRPARHVGEVVGTVAKVHVATAPHIGQTRIGNLAQVNIAATAHSNPFTGFLFAGFLFIRIVSVQKICSLLPASKL